MGKGLLIALGSGMALGSVTSLASLSYLEGGTVTHLLVLRGLLATLAVLEEHNSRLGTKEA